MKPRVFFVAEPRSAGICNYAQCITDSLKDRNDEVVIFYPGGTDFPSEEYKKYFIVSKS